MNHLRHAVYMALLTVLSGCASLGLAPAQNVSARLAYGYSQVTAVNNTIATSLDLRRISSADAKSFAATADQARDILDGARLAYEGGDLSDATNRLKLAITVLDQLALYMDRSTQP